MRNYFEHTLIKQAVSFMAAICCAQVSLVSADTCWVNDEDIRGLYSGGCKDGRANGFGIAIGVDIYKGEFQDGLKHGNGTYVWDSSVEHDPCCSGSTSILYVGEYSNGLRHGQGRMIYFNGNSYEGGFKDGARVGKTKFDLEKDMP